MQFSELFYGYTFGIAAKHIALGGRRGGVGKIFQSWQSKAIFYKWCAMQHYLKLDQDYICATDISQGWGG